MDDEKWLALPSFTDKFETAKRLIVEKLRRQCDGPNFVDEVTFDKQTDQIVRFCDRTHNSIPGILPEESTPLANHLQQGRHLGQIPFRKRTLGANVGDTTETSRVHVQTLNEKEEAGEAKSYVQGQQYGPPKKKPRRGPLPEFTSVTPINTRTTRHSSEWYENINMREKFNRRDLDSLKAIYGLIQECNNPTISGSDASTSFRRLRTRLHQAETAYDFLSGVLIKKSKLLDEGGLPSVFSAQNGIFPWDLRADSLALYQRWLYGRLDPHLLVGINTKQKKNAAGKSMKTYSLNRDYQGLRSANCSGENNLTNGQWWPLQICALRDGAHGEMEAGIHGQSGKGGAYSVVMSSGGYADIDKGESVVYCGTAGFDGKPSAGTTLLLEALGLQSPVRLLRSSALPASNRYRPQKGLRYDGLYNIDSFSVLDAKTAMYAFAMTRTKGQDPIRWQGDERRPTNEQLAEYAKIRQLMGFSN
ncbi:hypothetical protein MMC13_008221 [Lambiella insularis]|nr:hypothetical protein [Lambiella insularis]